MLNCSSPITTRGFTGLIYRRTARSGIAAGFGQGQDQRRGRMAAWRADSTPRPGLYQMMPLNLRLELRRRDEGLTAGVGHRPWIVSRDVDPHRLEQANAGIHALQPSCRIQARAFLQAKRQAENLFNKCYELPLGGVNFDDYMASVWMKPDQAADRTGTIGIGKPDSHLLIGTHLKDEAG